MNQPEPRDRWPGRITAVARLISPGSKVIDLGAGSQSLRYALPRGCRYTPADIVPTSHDCLPFDMNAGVWPTGRWDIAVMVGVLEYAERPRRVLDRLRSIASTLIVTYDHAGTDEGYARRLSIRGFRDAARDMGWKPRKVGIWEDPLVGSQLIWRLD